MAQRQYYTYIMCSPRGTLYVGMTNDLRRRVQEHKSRATPGFTARYDVTMLVWYETFADAISAIECEKRIKGWGRGKKLELIGHANPFRRDLSEDW